MPRGGPRNGRPGANYGNRSDLAAGPRKLPNQVAPGQTYGEAAQQQQSMQQVPMASGPLNQAPAAPQTPPDVRGLVKSFNPPPVVPLGMPSLRPDEHVMTNTPSPAPLQSTPVLKGVALLNALGDTASPEVKALRNVLAAQQANGAAP